MGVYQIRREMPAPELRRWYAHLDLSADEREKAYKRAQQKKRKL